MRPCPEYADDLVLLALEDPDLDDRGRVNEHIRTCSACRTYLADVRAALAGLGEPPPALVPPPDLKARVLAAARRQPPARPAEAGFAPEPVREAPAPAPAAIPAPLRRWLVAGLAAAVLLLALNITLGAWVLRLHSEVAALTRMLEVNGSQLMVAYDLMSLLDVSPDLTVDLRGDAPAPDAFGRASVYSTGTATLVVITAWDLPSLPGDTAVYQVWLGQDGERVNAGVFRADPRGNGVLIYRHPGTLDLDSVGITVEPDPYGDIPRGERVLVGLRDG